MPDQESELIAILADGQRQARYSSGSLANARISVQIRVYNFLLKGSEAKHWVGIVDQVGKTVDGERWIRIGIAPGITVSTFHDRVADPKNLTLIGPRSLVGTVLDKLFPGDTVIFDAFILGGLLTDDTQMLEAPQMMVRFDAIKPLR